MKQISCFLIAMFFCCTTGAVDRHNDTKQERDKIIDIDTVNLKKVKIGRHLDARFCDITFLTVDGKECLVKQKKFIYKLLGAARDPLTAWVAEALMQLNKGPIAHQVDIIPPHKKFPGKPTIEWPATLHTVAPGKVMRDLKGKKFPYSHIKMQQVETGLTREMITSMASHWLLAVMAALDTILCNHDRHKGNLFYDIRTDTFCAIDMDSSFKYNLPKLTYANFKKMLKNPRFTPQEKKALIQYRNTLVLLLEAFPLDLLIEKYDFFLKEAGFVVGAEFYPEKLQRLVAENKKIMRESYPYVKKIIWLLSIYIDQIKQKHIYEHPRLAKISAGKTVF